MYNVSKEKLKAFGRFLISIRSLAQPRLKVSSLERLRISVKFVSHNETCICDIIFGSDVIWYY